MGKPTDQLLAGLMLMAVFVAALVQRRHVESEVDLRGLELIERPAAMGEALTTLYALNRVPRRMALAAERGSTHPSLANRLKEIRVASDAPPNVTEASPRV